ncbi:hypothetical protein KIN20_020635 [Parelaphostrongylus tenuis]|uniref:Uncharacterized protein n=1 Tax=Parelaphostrongylus tenuis TaxID=148309 RepID=A0AAD5MMQ7_PARTN|nr:hypothetical protein KIN20_020635 [Parelaphostrongylus tenuis]
MTSVDESGVGVVRAKKRGRPAKPKAATTTDSEESTAAFNSVNDPSAPLEKKRGRKSLAEAGKEAPSKGFRVVIAIWLSLRHQRNVVDYRHGLTLNIQMHLTMSIMRSQRNNRKRTSGTSASDATVNGAPPRKRGRPSKKRNGWLKFGW